jgi:prevent-host-death family protein
LTNLLDQLALIEQDCRMVRQVNLYEAKTHLSRLVEDAAGGEEIVIAKNGKPIAKLSAAAEEPTPKKRELGQWAKYLTPDEIKYRNSPQFWRDWKAMDAEIERDFARGLEEEQPEDKKWRDISSTRTLSSTSRKPRTRSAKKRAKR